MKLIALAALAACICLSGCAQLNPDNLKGTTCKMNPDGSITCTTPPPPPATGTAAEALPAPKNF